MSTGNLLFSSYFFKGALDYLVDSGKLPAIVVDNTLLNDPTLDVQPKISGDDYVIILGHDYITGLEINSEEVAFRVVINRAEYQFVIPYGAIKCVIAYGTTTMLEDSGATNYLTMPVVVRAPGWQHRQAVAERTENTPAETQKDQVSEDIGPIMLKFRA